jgi:mannitol 2-dehydrogenase
MVRDFVTNKRGAEIIPVAWIDDHVQFPNSVSDRICHTENSGNFQALMDMGLRDEALLTTEKFRSWIVEDATGLPAEFRDLQHLRIVKDAKPHENLKTRLNYGLRVSLALVGQQLNHATFEEILADPLLALYAQKYLEEVKFGLGRVPDDVDLNKFGEEIIQRISTPGLQYQGQRLTEDVSRKLKMEWLPVIERLSTADRTSETLAFALASWTALLAGRVPGNLVDCNADILTPMAIRAVNGDPKWFLNAISDHKSLGHRFVEDYRVCLRSILLRGPRKALQDLLDQ